MISWMNIFLFIAVLSSTISEGDAVCGCNEIEVDCGLKTPPTCANPNPPPSPFSCEKRCSCRPGFIRNAKAECIGVLNCPAPLRCGRNETVETQGSDCPVCVNFGGGPGPVCRQLQETKCYCIPGYFRKGNDCFSKC